MKYKVKGGFKQKKTEWKVAMMKNPERNPRPRSTEFSTEKDKVRRRSSRREEERQAMREYA